MTEEDARKLAEKIIATWPAGAKHYIWKGVLADLDHHCAEVTYRQLRDNALSTPTPGSYLAAYRQTRARLTTQPKLFDAKEVEVISVAEYLARVQQHPCHGDTREHWHTIQERMRSRNNHPSTKELP